MNGIINVLKPPGLTSHDVVAYLRRLLRTKDIGHTGTLDPGVAGVLPVCAGTATRIAEFITESGKAYRAEITFGVTTDTQDGFGNITQQAPVKAEYAAALALIPMFTGRIRQVPPMVSAVKRGGKRLYELARQGLEVERPSREVTIEQILPVSYNWNKEFPTILFDVTCSKGTYIRTLCADWGARLGCGAHMSYLLRTCSGSFALAEAWTLEELAEAVGNGDYGFLLPVDRGIRHLPALKVRDHRVKALLNGLSLGPKDYIFDSNSSWEREAWVRLYGPAGDFLALGLINDSGHVRPKKVFGHDRGQKAEAGGQSLGQDPLQLK